MSMVSQTLWVTLLGVSFLFVGGFVLWVYGSHKSPDSSKKSSAQLAQWFFLYGALVSFAGIGCLLTAAMMVM